MLAGKIEGRKRVRVGVRVYHHFLELVTLHGEIKKLASIVTELASGARQGSRLCVHWRIHNFVLVLLTRHRSKVTTGCN